MKKAGIMTLYYKTYNYGAQLQAYALQKAVQKLGYKCEQICYKWYDADIEHFYQSQSGNIGKFREFAFSIPHSPRIYSPENIHEAAAEYDVFICGSDQIWGVPASKPRYVAPHMTLSFVPDDKVKFSYGASVGGAALTTDQIPPVKYWASRLDAVSVREQSAIPCIAELTEKEIISVLDPTLLLESPKWDHIAIPPKDNSEYIFTYNIGGDAELDISTKCLAKRLGCAIKTVSYSENDTTGPREFLGLIKNAKYVLTNSFHGTAFSVIFKKQFYAFPADNIQSVFSKNVRITDLFGKLGLENRFVSNADEADFTTTIDYDKVIVKLCQARDASFGYLRKSLLIEKLPTKTVVTHKDCCGCGVCGLACPQNCIEFENNHLGFNYPKIDETNCTDCGICRKRCPIERAKWTAANGKKTYAAINRNLEVRKNSSSGGAFSALAGYVIEQGGVVFGAMYDGEFNVIHSYTETMEGTAKFRCSKYVQSDLNNTFKETENFLKQGRLVLYSGCGCQINALKAYLNHDYVNLFTVDLICGGVTSSIYWDKYLKDLHKYGELLEINQRTKVLGYHNSENRAVITTSFRTSSTSAVEPSTQNIYMYPRFSFYRDNCGSCGIKANNHLCDLSLGDMIGALAPQFNDGYGISMIFARTQKGEQVLRLLGNKLEINVIAYADAVAMNSMIEGNLPPLAWRDYMRSIFNASTASEIYYEHKLCENENATNVRSRNFYTEIKRNSIYVKLLKYQMYGCLLDDEPCLQGKVIIYGAGKIGRLAAECSENKVLCFVDGSDKLKSVAGLPVFNINDDKLKSLITEAGDITFVITPVWDFEDIYQNIILHFPAANVISIEKAVEKLWE
ncbi:MAG: polysaccharide pyruvyl transferase family protein [Gracilibacteraceae bacterium]|jgi:coenzyme F420-reducing hydrogenase beta subunit|nr:polysaccharide pyruvyl transferase family protein [Gracilibacteraceae bacterium]